MIDHITICTGDIYKVGVTTTCMIKGRVHGAIAEHWLCVQGRIQKVYKRGDGLLASYGERNTFFSGLRIPRPSVSKN